MERNDIVMNRLENGLTIQENDYVFIIPDTGITFRTNNGKMIHEIINFNECIETSILNSEDTNHDYNIRTYVINKKDSIHYNKSVILNIITTYRKENYYDITDYMMYNIEEHEIIQEEIDLEEARNCYLLPRPKKWTEEDDNIPW